MREVYVHVGGHRRVQRRAASTTKAMTWFWSSLWHSPILMRPRTSPHATIQSFWRITPLNMVTRDYWWLQSHTNTVQTTIMASATNEKMSLPHHRNNSSSRRRRRRSGRSATESSSDMSASSSSSSNNTNQKATLIAVILGLCLMNVLDVDIRIGHSNSNNGGRRSLLSTLYLAGPSTLLPWAQHHLVDVMDKPDVEAETALFWRK